MILYNTTEVSHLKVGTLVLNRIHQIVTFFTDVKNLHDFFKFSTGMANFYKMLGIFRFVITILEE